MKVTQMSTYRSLNYQIEKARDKETTCMNRHRRANA